MRAYVVLVALASVFLVSVGAISWEEYKVKYNKHYSSPVEEIKRHAIFRRNLARIEMQNGLDASFKVGVNHLTDLSRAEYLKLNGFRASKKQINSEPSEFLLALLKDNSTVPDSIDYSQMPERVSPVKDQGQCGSCWSFATTGLLEGQEKRRTTIDEVVTLSEQELVDCDDVDQGCNGGNMDSALDFIKTVEGLEREKDYPYKSASGKEVFKCAYEQDKVFAATRNIKSSEQLPQGDEEALKKVVAKYGPVAVAMDASSDQFQMYQSGVYYNEACRNEPDELDHAVLVVGYGTDPEHGDYWLVKNSWSTTWGDQGYFKLARNKNNHCGVATQPIIAVFEAK